jgi:tetraacyldisaccharide 4'-kinase
MGLSDTMRLSRLHRKIARGEAAGPERALEALLFPLALLYGAGVAVRNWAYDRGFLRTQAVAALVVSVGGLTTGGSGKTPFAAYLANRVLEWGYQPLLVARGYGAITRPGPARIISSGEGAPAEGWESAGEESLLLARLAPKVPVAVAVRRSAALEVARQAGEMPQVLILDGGFQHRALRSDLSIVLLDVSRPPGRTRLLPLGEMREPWQSIKRADLLVLHRRELCDDPGRWERFLDRRAPGIPRVWSANRLGAPYLLVAQVDGQGKPGTERAEIVWEALRDCRLGLWTALAHPEAFVEGLARQGVTPAWLQLERDHAPFGRSAADLLRRAAVGEELEGFLVSEKDAVKIAPVAATLPPIFVVPASIELVRGADLLLRRLRALLAEHVAAPLEPCV